MDLLASPSSSVRSLRFLRTHAAATNSAYDGGSDDEDVHRHHDEQNHQQQQQQEPPPTASPQLSLRRILEQRNLLSMRRVPSSAPYLVARYGADDGAPRSHLHLPSLRFAHFPQVRDAEHHELSLFRDRAHSTGSADGDYGMNNTNRQTSTHDTRHSFLPQQQRQLHQPAPASISAAPAPTHPTAHERTAEPKPAGLGHSHRPTMTPEERRKARTCVVDGCSNYIVDSHRCFRHGGGKRCLIEGCNSSAKQFGLCWRHGGSVLCKVEGCNRGVKVKGLCWGHGGGKKNKQASATNQTPDSSTDTGGLRCIFDGCQSTATLHSFCETHSRVVVRPGYVFEL